MMIRIIVLIDKNNLIILIKVSMILIIKMKGNNIIMTKTTFKISRIIKMIKTTKKIHTNSKIMTILIIKIKIQ